MVGAYFVEWGVYGRKFMPKDIPVENLTHIFYGFIPVCGDNTSLTGTAKAALDSQCAGKQDYEVVVHDKFAALEKNDLDSTGKWDDEVKGIFAEMYRIKKAYPHIKIVPSIGGWTLSDPLFEVGINASARATFIASTIEMLKQYEFFDGLDVDWEFPGGGGANPALGTSADGEGFATLMVEMRTALDALSAETGRHYELTAAMSGGVEKLSHVNWEKAAPVMDFVNLMTYDYYGAWSTTYGHQTGLYDTNGLATPIDGYTIDDAVTYLTEQRSVPAGKLGIGVAMYGRGWKGISGGDQQGPFNGAATGGSPITGTTTEGFWEAGILDYKGAETYMMGGAEGTGINGYNVFFDDAAKASYIWNPSNGTYITLDTKRSVIEKGKYVQEKGLAGLFAWEIDGDSGSILNSMHEGLGHPAK
jgi:chitinase